MADVQMGTRYWRWSKGLLGALATLPSALLLIQAGCEAASQKHLVWQTPTGATQSQFDRAFYECKRNNLMPLIRDYTTNLVVLHPVPEWEMVNKCMAVKGYRSKVVQ
jgi:hypothetical protein